MGEWIKCSDSMPDKGRLVFVYCDGCCDVGIAHVSRIDGEWKMPEPQSIGYESITHWQPLPEPPHD